MLLGCSAALDNLLRLQGKIISNIDLAKVSYNAQDIYIFRETMQTMNRLFRVVRARVLAEALWGRSCSHLAFFGGVPSSHAALEGRDL